VITTNDLPAIRAKVIALRDAIQNRNPVLEDGQEANYQAVIRLAGESLADLLILLHNQRRDPGEAPRLSFEEALDFSSEISMDLQADLNTVWLNCTMTSWYFGAAGQDRLRWLADLTNLLPFLSPKPLTEAEEAVLSVIPFKDSGKGITGKEIVAALAKKGFELSENTLTRHIIPKLKESYGVENRRGVGYYRSRAT
jgi:hypothetical protein